MNLGSMRIDGSGRKDDDAGMMLTKRASATHPLIISATFQHNIAMPDGKHE
jgi:hypothetical protein